MQTQETQTPAPAPANLSKTQKAEKVSELLGLKPEKKANDPLSARLRSSDRTTDTEKPDPDTDGTDNEDTGKPIPHSEPEETGQAEENEENGAASGEESEPVTLKELAAELKIEPKELYSVAIPMGEGKTMTLGEIKNLAKEAGDIKQRMEEYESTETERSNDIMRARDELNLLVSALGQNVPPQARAAMEEITQRQLAQERAAMLNAIPQWRDKKAMLADQEEILDFVKRYGFNERELSAVSDHRLVKLLRDMAKGHAAAKQAAAQAKKPPKQPQSTGKPAAAGNSLRSAIARAKQSGASRSDKLAGISALLK